MSTGIIILAAGSSSRLGKPKQLLAYKGKTLLEIATEATLATNFKPIITVLGAYADEIARTYQNQYITYIVNDSWQEGMASSISAGLTEVLRQDPTIENIIITVADQVFLTSELLLNLLIKHQETGKNIIASTYAKTTGTPSLFNKQYFDKLMALGGNSGAKHILQQHSEDMATVDFELGHIDIDTETDYNKLIGQK